jgi:hypothetical protein
MFIVEWYLWICLVLFAGTNIFLMFIHPLIQAHKHPDGKLIPMEAGDYRGAFAISLFVGLPLVNLYSAYIAYLYNFKPEKI